MPANGEHRRLPLLEALNNVTISLIVVILTVAWAYVFVFATNDRVDATMFERVLIFVLGVAFGAQAVKRGVEQGTTAALTPAPPAPAPGTTTTTTTTTPEVKP